MVPSELLQLLQLMAVLLGRLTAFTARQTTEAELLKGLVDRICHETGPFLQDYRTSFSKTADDPFYEYVQICYTVKRRKVEPSRMDELVTSNVNTDVRNMTDEAEEGEPAGETSEDWARYDPHTRNTSLWITLVIAAMSIAIVVVILLGPRYMKKCLQAIRRRTGNGRWDNGFDRTATDDNMRYLYGEWDPATESERTTPSGFTVNTVGLVMSTYVTGAAVGSTYDNATGEGGFVYTHDDVDFEVARTSETGGRHVTADVMEICVPGDDDSTEFEQTEESEDCDESGSVENDDDNADNSSQKEEMNSDCATGKLPSAANGGFDDVNRCEGRTGSSSIDACACSMSDDVDTDWSCQADSSFGDSVASTCEENIMPP